MITGINNLPREDAYTAATDEISRVQQEIQIKLSQGIVLSNSDRAQYFDWLQRIHNAAGIPQYQQWELNLVNQS